MKIAIVGGGIAGMSLAYFLTEKGHSVQVYEKGDAPGGLARSFSLGGNPLEVYYHHIFLNDAHTLALIEELGLKHRLIAEESAMGIYCDGRVYPFGRPLDLLGFKPLTFKEKARFALSTLYLKNERDYAKLEAISAEEFLLANAGRKVYEKIWEPLLATKFGEEDYKEITASWLQARVSARGKSRQNIFRNEKLLYLSGSLKVLFDELSRRIKDKGGVIATASRVERVDISGTGKVNVRVSQDSNAKDFDACCLCLPNPVILDIAGHILDGEFINLLAAVKYRAVLCAILAIRGSLSRYYWINISKRDIPFTGLMEHTNLVSKEEYDKNHIVYLSRYISSDDPRYNMEEGRLIDLYSGHIKDIFPGFDKSLIRDSFVFRDLYAQPVVTKGYARRIPPRETPLKNIFINNTAQIYPQDRGMSPGIKNSRELAERINSLR